MTAEPKELAGVRVVQASESDRRSAVNLLRESLPRVAELPEIVARRHVLVAKNGKGLVVGAAAYAAWPDVGLADLTFLAAAEKNRGVGSKLVAELLTRLGEQGITHVYLQASRGKTFRFFTKAGFTPTISGEFPGKLLLGRVCAFTEATEMQRTVPRGVRKPFNWRVPAEVEVLVPGGELLEVGLNGAEMDAGTWRKGSVVQVKGDQVCVEYDKMTSHSSKEWLLGHSPRLRRAGTGEPRGAPDLGGPVAKSTAKPNGAASPARGVKRRSPESAVQPARRARIGGSR